MYLEQAISLAQENGLFYAQFKLMIAYGGYLEETISALSNLEEKSAVAANVFSVYKEAGEIAQKLCLENLKSEADKAVSVFKTYCKLNGISVNVNV